MVIMNRWTLGYDVGFIDQMSRLDIKTQDRIQKEIRKIMTLDDPRQAGSYNDCGDAGDCPYIVQIYPGLAFEFTYEMNTRSNVLTYVDCFKLDILNHGQEPNI